LSWLARRFSIDAVLPSRARRALRCGYVSGRPRGHIGHGRFGTFTRPGTDAVTRWQRDDRDVLRRSEPWHRGDRSGALRAGVFGVNDGLVSNTSVVMGFAGSGASASVILFAGLAGLLAGALSMAAGEYISMRSQREAYQREITLEAQDLRDDPEAEAEELSLIYRARGLDAEEAERVATTIMKDREAALDTMAREELGLDPDELGSPWSAALSSLGAFAAGAVVVVAPYMFSSGWAALIAAIVLASLALFAVGAVIGVLNGRGGLRSGMRQLLIGGGAALLVYVIGRGVGALTAVQLGA
jgi:vacuolar iron transporter family protein